MNETTGGHSNERSIAEWCQAAAAGDHAAIERLLLVHHDRLTGLAIRKIGPDWRGRIEPEDLLQEAYVEIFKAIGSFEYRGPDSFFHWAARIVDHRFIDHVRRLRRKKRDVAREARSNMAQSSRYQTLVDLCVATDPTASRVMRRQDAMAAVLACLARLGADDRMVIERYHLQQEPLKTIAEDMGRTEDAVRRLAGRALDRLAACVGRASQYLSMGG